MSNLYGVASGLIVLISVHTGLATPLDSTLIATVHARWQANRYIRPDSSYYYAQRLYTLAKQSRQPADLAQGLLTLGIEERDRGNYTEAVRYMQQALPYREQLNDRIGVATIYQSLALTYKRMGDSQHVTELTRQALAYANQAFGLFQGTNARPGQLANALNTIAIIERDLQHLSAAYQAYRRAIALLEPIQTTLSRRDLTTLAMLYGNMGQYLSDTGQPDRAIEQLNKALSLNTRLAEKTSLEHNHRNLSYTYQRKYDYPRAIDHARQALTLSRQIKDPHRLFNTLSVAYKTYRDAGDYKQALLLLEEQKLIEDSLLRADKSRQIMMLQAQFETDRARQLAEVTAQKDRLLAETRARMELAHQGELARTEADKIRDLSRLQAKAALAQAELKARYAIRSNQQTIRTLNLENSRSRQQVLWLGIGGSLFVVLSGLLLLLYQRVRHSRTEVQRQSEQLRLLMRELHHRVKNNLAVVSGLLELQANRLGDAPIRQAFVESQQRVQAMSLIHQRLYHTDATTRINLRDFTLSLIDSLSHAYGYSSDTLTYKLRLDVTDADVDIAIPLGLVMNELLTNAFKYAFPLVAHPRLTVHLSHDDDDNLRLLIADNGPGFDVAASHRGKSSFGQRLIHSLTEQMGAYLTVDASNGTVVTMLIPNHVLQTA